MNLGAQVVTADDAGRFHLLAESDPDMIMVAHRSGYAEISPADVVSSGFVTLRTWCRTKGRVAAGTKPVAGQKVSVYRFGFPSGDSPTPSWEDEAVTDADGRFACDRVTHGRLVVDRLFSGGAVNGIVKCNSWPRTVSERSSTPMDFRSVLRPRLPRPAPWLPALRQPD